MTIRGQLFPHEGGMGKSRFLLPESEEGDGSAHSTVICSVEDLSLAHYRQLGFDQGKPFTASPNKIQETSRTKVERCLLCERNPWRRINILNLVCSPDVGHYLYGRYSRCLQKPIPGRGTTNPEIHNIYNLNSHFYSQVSQIKHI